MRLPLFIFTSVWLTLTLSLAGAEEPPIQVSLGELRDMRTDGRFFGGLEVNIKLAGEGVIDAESARIEVDKCIDDTDRDLIDPQQSNSNTTFGNTRSGGQTLTVPIHLKNPLRRAKLLKELSGRIELYIPTRDPDATVLVAAFRKSVGAPCRRPP